LRLRRWQRANSHLVRRRMKRFFDRRDETSNKFSALRAITSGSPIL